MAPLLGGVVVDVPETQYAKTRDGVHIAYQVIGEGPIDVRVGLHTGEIERHGEDIAGLAVHIGARVAAVAEPNEVLVSSTVKDLVVGSGIRFDERGEHELKGVPGTWKVYAVEA
jgi:class 3 adenylate cyclase